MTKLFISYRREDSQHAAGRLYLALCTGHMSSRDLFLDIYNIPGGVDFTEDYEASIAKSDVLLALIGSKWAEAGRLNNPDNHVRRELLAAKKHSVSVLPLLLDDTQMPKAADLPEELRFICNLSAEHVTHVTFDDDAPRLLRTAKGLAQRKATTGPLSQLLQEQLDQELENTRNERRRCDFTGLDQNLKMIVQLAQGAELKAIDRQYHARGAAENGKKAARRAADGEGGTEVREITMASGGQGRWAGEGSYGQRRGFGEYTAPTKGGGGYAYAGQWKDDRESGLGVTVWTDANGAVTVRSEGEMTSGKQQGFGAKVLSSGDAYLGEFVDGKLHGPGVYRWANGTRLGCEWRAGKRNGVGVQWRADGSPPLVSQPGDVETEAE
jgi:hypothetical protein